MNVKLAKTLLILNYVLLLLSTIYIFLVVFLNLFGGKENYSSPLFITAALLILVTLLSRKYFTHKYRYIKKMNQLKGKK